MGTVLSRHCLEAEEKLFPIIMAKKWKNGDFMLMHEKGYYQISHVVGSAPHKRNWKKFWTSSTSSEFPRVCQILGCGNPAKVGAHVYVKRLRQIFILPTCQECNHDPEQVYDGTKNQWISTKKTAVVVRVDKHQNTYQYWGGS